MNTVFLITSKQTGRHAFKHELTNVACSEWELPLIFLCFRRCEPLNKFLSHCDVTSIDSFLAVFYIVDSLFTECRGHVFLFSAFLVFGSFSIVFSSQGLLRRLCLDCRLSTVVFTIGRIGLDTGLNPPCGCIRIKKWVSTLITTLLYKRKMTLYGFFEQWRSSFKIHEGFVEVSD